ncbi:hypothetical protein [Natrononativus amylolyticus]|uniref:hypothetical protein n=1 Tax=Natrononativus amylolyticus TaxID=2963434 RepID=UPI0020CF86E4|nr:hypothetical protein [Natrononativus amylolyticus]
MGDRGDGRAGEQVRATGPEIAVPVRARFLETNDPVSAGERLEATVSVDHIGEMEDVGPVPDLHLVVGDEVVDSVTLDLEWNETTERTMGYETYPVNRDGSFEVRLVAGDTVADRHTVTVSA